MGQVTNGKSFVLLTCMDQGGKHNPLNADLGSCDRLKATRNISHCDECPGNYCVPDGFKELQNGSAPLLESVSRDEETDMISDSSSTDLLVIGIIGFLSTIGLVLACVIGRGCCIALHKKQKTPRVSGLSARGLTSTDTVCNMRDLERPYTSNVEEAVIMDTTFTTAEVHAVERPTVANRNGLTSNAIINTAHDNDHGRDQPTGNLSTLTTNLSATGTQDPLSRQERAAKESILAFPENDMVLPGACRRSHQQSGL